MVGRTREEEREHILSADPFHNGLNIVVSVAQILADHLPARVQEGRVGGLAWLDGDGPRADLDAGGQVVLASVGLGGGEVHVAGASRRVVLVEGVEALELAGVGVHAAGCLAGLDVSPDHGGHVTLVVPGKVLGGGKGGDEREHLHEASVKVWCLVWVGADNVGRATREWVLEEVEHGEELAGWHESVVAVEAGDDRVVHDWLVGLVLEVALPSRAELLAWPAVHLPELLFIRSYLDTSINAIGS